VYLQRLVYFGEGDAIAENTTMKAEQSLFASLAQRQSDLIGECEKLAAEFGLLFRASGATTPFESVSSKGPYPWQGCMRPWKLMYITVNGTALPCCIAPFATHDYSQIILGNVLRDSVAHVWQDHPYQELRLAVLGEDPHPWPCKHCGVKWSL
jgi:MoaA/NifB/PqqE/SkfB family radical SAM enzyme